MIKVEYSVVINRPVVEVFTFLTDPANEPKWQDGVVAAGLTSDYPIGIDSEGTETRKFIGRDMVSKVKVTRYEANKQFGIKVMDGPVPFEVHQIFETVGEGTKVSITIEGEPGGFFKLAEGLVRKQMETEITSSFEKAKKLLEGEK